MTDSLNLVEMGKKAKEASYTLAQASNSQKNQTLHSITYFLKKHQNNILDANQQDIDAAKKQGLSEALLDRLSLQGRLEGVISDLQTVIQLRDPVGELFDEKILANGLKVAKCRTPLGVIGAIYESRPNVTIDITGLALKTGNCVILRGGSETLRTNQAIVHAIQKALNEVNLPSNAVQFINHSDRQYVYDLLRLHNYVDLIIPRGGATLHHFCRENSQIPVITGGIGICHLFVDETADLERAIQVIINAKTQRPTVCNALDTLLVHQHIANTFIPAVIEILKEYHVTCCLSPKAWQIMQGQSNTLDCIRQAQEKDWDTEWLSLVLGIQVVANLEEAVQHIRQHSTGHSDGILTQDFAQAQSFVQQVDSAAVYVNASTRFTDGSQLGLGAEVAISTQKLHARGPMGLRELTTYKWIIWGDYHIRS